MKKERIEFIDLAKGFCIILVVFNHIHKGYDAPYLLADSFKMFRMPLYFFLSGLFFKSYDGVFGFIKKKTNKLLIPFTFFFLLTSFLLPNTISFIANDRFKIELLWSFFYPEFFPNFPIWFLLCLFELNFFFYIIYMFSQRIKDYNLIVMSILTGIIGYIGYYLGYNRINLPMFIDSAMSAMPFFYAGFITRKYTPILHPNKLDKFTFPIAGVLLFITYLFACHIDYSTNNFSNVSFIRVYGCGITGIFFVLFLAKAIKTLPFISYLGKYSIIVLCTHFIFVVYLKSVINIYISKAWISIFIILIITLSLYVFIIPFMKKYMPHVTAQKDVITN